MVCIIILSAVMLVVFTKCSYAEYCILITYILCVIMLS
jgi:hypothetical protein